MRPMRSVAIFTLTAAMTAAILGCSSNSEPDDGDDDGTMQPPPSDDIVCAAAGDGWALRPANGAPLEPDERAAIGRRLLASLADEEAAWPDEPPQDCADPDAVAYLLGLRSRGDAATCLAYALACTDEAARDPKTVGALALYGAGCAAVERQVDQATALYDLATTPDAIGGCPDARGRAFAYATFAVDDAPDLDVGAILDRADGWDPARAEEVIRLLASGATPGDPASLEAWIDEAATGSDPLLGLQAVLAWIGELDAVLGDRDGALREIGGNLEPLAGSGRARAMVPTAFLNLYSRSGGDLGPAGEMYAGYIPFAPRHGWLPNEYNVHTYTELYDDVCADALLAGEALGRYQDLRSGWIAGEIATPDALAEVRAQLDAEGERSDLLGLLGAMLEAGGDTGGAADAYWRAHQLCPYYNRAHWALRQLDLTRRLHNRSPLPTPPLPAKDALADYVVNYDSLSDDERAGLRHGLAIWLPYLEDLIGAGNSFYAKRPFELLSEAPGNADLRDQRVAYEGDYRLWDDVRGVGGNPVVSDISEVALTRYGAYNLAVHEVAHQLHFSAPAAIGACIQALYDGAAERDLFVNFYAAQNPEEYFAEGVTYFSVPVDAPGSFGTNRQWLLDNDPDLESLIAAFEGQTPLAEVTCPVEVPVTLRRAPAPSRLWRLRHGTAQHRLAR